MKKAVVEAWLSGLRSGKYKQHRGTLCNGEGRNKLDNATAFCCIGVAGVISKEDFSPYYDTHRVGMELGMFNLPNFIFIEEGETNTRSAYDHLIYMNDKEKKSFAEIADWIEANILPNATEE